MHASMMQWRAEILCQIAAGRLTGGIPKNLHLSPKLAREIRDSLNTRASFFQLHRAIIGPQKATLNADHVDRLKHFNQLCLWQPLHPSFTIRLE
jgi:hypothetical protein